MNKIKSNELLRDAEEAISEARRIIECTPINSAADAVNALAAVGEALSALLALTKMLAQ